ncbi:MAG: hypothetical protein ACTHK3_04410 [Solirubrobacterales bacterium]
MLKEPERAGWSVGSFEGGWASDEEIRELWGPVADKATEEDQAPAPAVAEAADD